MKMLSYILCCVMMTSWAGAKVPQELPKKEDQPAQEILPALPTCDDEKLLNHLANKIKKHYEKTPAESLLEKRSRQLSLRSIQKFTEVDVASFDVKTDRQVANKLISAKINEGLENSEVRLCRTVSQNQKKPIYLLIYPENYYYRVEVINFMANTLKIHNIFFIYS